MWLGRALAYRVAHSTREVFALESDEEGRALRAPYAVELHVPLSTEYFCQAFLRFFGLGADRRQRELFERPQHRMLEEPWIAREAYRRLRADPRFRELRGRRLPQALGLDPTLVGIALAARALPLGPSLPSAHYSRVWLEEEKLRVVARENPRLLPVIAAALSEKRLPPAKDPVQGLRDLFIDAGLRPATWRYLACHGARLLRPAWSRDRRRYVDRAIEWLRALQEAGLPPPAPRWAMARLHDRLGFVAPAVMRACCVEVRRVRGTAGEAALRHDMDLVLDWAVASDVRLDKLQQRAGWPWLRRRALGWQRELSLLQAGGSEPWPCEVTRLEEDGLVALAIEDARQLADAAEAFHNCMAMYAARCRTGSVRLFVVSEAASGRRLAVAGLIGSPRHARWGLLQVAGIANEPVPERIAAFARRVAHEYGMRAARAAKPGTKA